MLCPICVSEGEKTRDSVDVKDMLGHFLRLHTKTEIAKAFADVLWNDGTAPAV